jgi:voltage-gated potassium channel Kch
MSKHIICVGSGRLAWKVAQELREKNYEVRQVTSEVEQSVDSLSRSSAIDHITGIFREAGIDSARAVFLLDDEDRHNIEMALVAISRNKHIPIFVALFNEALASHLQATHPNLRAISPAGIAAPRFVECIRAEQDWKPSYQPPAVERVARRDPLEQRSMFQVYALIAAFCILLLAGLVFFHQVEGRSWLDAFYAVTRVVATDDFGDPGPRTATAAAKLFGVCVMFSAVALVAITIALIADRLVKRNAEIALGRKRYRLRGHVIVCGLGRVGVQIVDELLRAGESVLVMEEKPENRFLATVRAHGARVFVGDASLSNNLSDAGVSSALALVSVINDDLKNLEIGMNARSLRPDLRLILRIFDKGIADEMRRHLDIHFALSTSVLAAERLVEILEKDTGAKAGG